MGIEPVEPPEVELARREGIASSHGEVIPGVSAVAAPIRGAVRAAVAVLYVSAEAAAVVDAVRKTAARLTQFNR